MTVAELIQRLQQLPPTAQVYVYVEADDYHVDVCIEVESVEWEVPYVSGDRSRIGPPRPQAVVLKPF